MKEAEITMTSSQLLVFYKWKLEYENMSLT